ncbi:MAG: FAD-binding oxidoreductase [Pseudomonadota bacterium]
MKYTEILPKGVSAEDFAQAVELWKEKIGSGDVLLDSDIIQTYSKCTLPIERSVAAVLKPGSVEDVQSIVEIAGTFKIPLYTISKGRNWGYGSACPVQDNNVIVDLGRMNRILDVNTELAYAVVEPGVTQGQLYQYLKDNRIPLWIDATGAPPDASLIGNTLERGFGHSRYGNHFESACGMEVVLADGRILRTGFGHYEQARAASLFKGGLGPYLDGIFTQSNYGIVTKMGMWLMPKPPDFLAFFFQIDSEKKLKPLIEALRPLRMSGIVQSCVHIGNDMRVLSHIQQYPWELAGYQTPLPEWLRNDLRKKWGLYPWSGSGALYGTREQIAASRKAIKNALRGIARVFFVSDRTIRLAERIKGLYKIVTGVDLTPMLSLLKPVYGLMKGIPTEMPIAGTYWRVKKPIPKEGMNPDRDRCGLMWCSPVIPMTGDAAGDLLHIAKPIFDKYGFDMIISMTLITERAIDCVMAISYDKSDPEDTPKASECYEQLLQTFMRVGYIPYRIGIQSMGHIMQKGDVFWDVVQDIKKALDPDGILSPGRYGWHKATE